VSRRQGYLQFLPSTQALTEQYYQFSHGPLLQELFLNNEINQTRSDIVRMYQQRKYSGSEDLANVMTCASLLVETPLGDRYVPFQTITSAASEYCGQSRAFAESIANMFCRQLANVPGIESVSFPRRVGGVSSPSPLLLLPANQLNLHGVSLPNSKRKVYTIPEPHPNNTVLQGQFSRASDTASPLSAFNWRANSWGHTLTEGSMNEDQNQGLNNNNLEVDEDEISLTSITARPDDLLQMLSDSVELDTEANMDMDEWFTTCTPPMTPTVSSERKLDTVAREVRRRTECATPPPGGADRISGRVSSYGSGQYQDRGDLWPAGPRPVTTSKSAQESNYQVRVEDTTQNGKRRVKHTPRRHTSSQQQQARY